MKKKCLLSIFYLLSLASCTISFSSFPFVESSSSSSSSTSLSIDPNASTFVSNSTDNSDINTHFDGVDLSNYVGIPTDYYASISSWNNGDELKAKLADILNQDNVKKMSYLGNWEINRLADEDLYNHDMVNQLYSSEPILKYNCKANSQEGWDREHAFCASLMTGMLTGDAVEKTDIAQDFHNLFASWTKANVSRGNKNYGEVEADDGEGHIGENDYDNDEFKPCSKEDCAEGARAIFYMATRYYNDPNYPLSVQEAITSKGDKAHGNLSDLLDWNKTLPSRNEIHHNASVYYYQNNRNPYIDYPELIDYVFGEKKNEKGELKNLHCTIDDSISNTTFSNYCIDEGKYYYKVGESFSKANYPLYSVKGDFSMVKEEAEAAFSGIEDGYVFTSEDVGKKEIQVSFPDQSSISFPIYIEDDAIGGMAYKHYFSMDDFEVGEGITSFQKNIDGNLYTFSYGNETTASLFNDKKGIRIGTAKKSIKKLTIESDSIIKNCKGFALSGGVASGCSADVDFYIAEEKLGSTLKLDYQSDGGSSTISERFDGNKSGKFKIVISNFEKALYLNAFAIDFE